VTYFSDPASVSGDGYSSTVAVSVNGVEWQEVRSFYDQSPTAQVYVLREDDSGQTHVTFGDGVNGARLPTGTGNVVATYRFGSGGDAPSAETLTNVMTPTPGLKGFRNPLPPTGGTNADLPKRLRQLAPASVLTLNRVVSIDDFEAVAETAPGVTQATASFAFDPLSQRPKATIWVAGDQGAVNSAITALAGAGAPMGNVRVLAATPIVARLTVNFNRDPRYGEAAVEQALLTALVDPDTGVLGANVLGIGQGVYESQIAKACLAVPGVASVQSIFFAPVRRFVFFRRRFGVPSSEALRNDPGIGNYFVVPNDSSHVSLVGVVP
jgi:predicted phage baseplate assembly protein